jgi:hypothetical protein
MTKIKVDAELRGQIKQCRNCESEIDCDKFFVRSRKYELGNIEAFWFCSNQCFYDFNKDGIEIE